MNTIITEKTENGEVSYDVFSKLAESRIIFLYDYITDQSAADVVATLFYLDNQNDKEKISLYINSDGGDLTSIFMIYDVMKMLKSPIETLCIGSSMYETTLILAAGTKGMRYATKSSTVCMKQLIAGHNRYSNITDAEIILEKNKKDNSRFVTELSECIGKSVKHILKDSERQFFMSPEIAKKYGIIDSIVGNKNEK